MPDNDDRDLKRRLAEYLDDTGGERQVIQGMFTKVLAEIGSLRSHVDEQIRDVRQEVRGLQSRVTVIEDDRRKTPSRVPPKALGTYEKTDTGTYRLTDFELHDLHGELATWRTIKSVAGKVAVPVLAALVLALLAFLGAGIWHSKQPPMSVPTGQVR
jgi:hypothetical protein